MGQQQSSISLSSSGTISLKRSYICGNYNSTHYYVQNNVTGIYELISADATQTISYALSKLTSGRTWQETVLLKGTFSIGTTITLSQANVLLDCRQATLTSTADILLDVKSTKVTILGGHWIGQGTQTYKRIQFGGTSATNCTVDGIDAENFVLELAYASSYITVQNCYFHDTTNNYFLNVLGVAHHNRFINCRFITGVAAAAFVHHTSGYNQFIGCEFGYLNNHGIYLDGQLNTDPSVGHNIVTGCTFHDFTDNAGLHIKCQNNTIYNNTFYNFTGAVGLSIYSEYSSGATANDNEIYGNTFRDMSEAIWVGHNPANLPTLRNKIHDNTFTNVTNCIRLNPWEGAIETTEDTWIYYNDFYSCTNPFPATGGSASLIKNTVIAYNTFDATVPNAEVVALKSYVNTMIYGNTPWMADFNVPSPLPIPPR
jgi:hypothetical protein